MARRVIRASALVFSPRPVDEWPHKKATYAFKGHKFKIITPRAFCRGKRFPGDVGHWKRCIVRGRDAEQALSGPRAGAWGFTRRNLEIVTVAGERQAGSASLFME